MGRSHVFTNLKSVMKLQFILSTVLIECQARVTPYCSPAVAKWEDCQAICKLTMGCEFWTVVPSDADPDAHSHAPFGCYLKYGSGWEMKDLNEHVSGDKSGAIVWMNKGLPGGDMPC